ncbi:MAG TPA: hypothetical protein VFG87_06060 [Amycolatopsis sp.]|nr:hypothetical protein [Amycolatopsis sp.]
MSIELPAGLADVFSLLSGQKWPEGDEDKLFAMGDGLVGVGQQFSDVSGNFNAAAGAVQANVGGAPANQFYDFAAQLQGNLPTMSQTAVDLGTMSRNMAAQVEYAKYMVIVQLVWLSYEIAQWMVFLPEAVPMFVEAADLAVAAILRRLLASAAIGGVSMAAMDLAVQGIQKLKGDRTSINWASTIGSAEAGVLGGALGGAGFTLGSKAIGAVAKSALSDSSVVKKVINSVGDPHQMEGVTSGLSATDKAALGAASTAEKIGLGVVTGATVSPVMSAAFGGPEETGLSAASGAAGMLTGERRGSVGADAAAVDLPPDLNTSGVDSAAAKLITPLSVPDSVDVSGIGVGVGVTDSTPTANSSTVTEIGAPGSVSTSDAGGLTGLATTLIGDTGGRSAPTAPGESGSGAPVTGSAGQQARAPRIGGTGGVSAGTTSPGAGRDGVVTESAGPRASGAGETNTGGAGTSPTGVSQHGIRTSATSVPATGTGEHEVAAAPAGSGQTGAGGTAGAQGAPRDVTTPFTGTGTTPVPELVVTGGAPSAPSAGGGSGGTEAGAISAHTAAAETAKSISPPAEPNGPVPSVSGMSRVDGQAGAAVTSAGGTGANPATATSGPERLPATAAPSGTAVSRPVTESPAPMVASAKSPAGVSTFSADRGLDSLGSAERGTGSTSAAEPGPQVVPPAGQADRETGVTGPTDGGQRPPASASAGAPGPKPTESTATGGSRRVHLTGLPGLETYVADRSVTGHDGTTDGTIATAFGEPSGSGVAVDRQAPRDDVAGPDTDTSTGDSRTATAGNPAAMGGASRRASPVAGSRDLVGQAPVSRPVGRGGGPVDEESGTDGAPHTAVESGDAATPRTMLESARSDPVAGPLGAAGRQSTSAERPHRSSGLFPHSDAGFEPLPHTEAGQEAMPRDVAGGARDGANPAVGHVADFAGHVGPAGYGGHAPTEVFAGGTRWVRDGGGWYVATHDGGLRLGPQEGGHGVDLPAESRAVVDGSGGLRHVVLPDGVSYDRGLNGRWSRGRDTGGDLIVSKLGTPRPLEVVGPRGERSSVLLPAESEVVHDRIGGAVSYRQLTGEDGMRLSVPRTFVHDGRADWVELVSAPGAVEYEAWLAGANQAHEAARVLFDIAARSGPDVPERLRLTNLPESALRELLHGSRDDAIAAIYETVRRREGVALRWTQLSAATAFAEGKIVNMAAGEGKSWLFLVDAARQSVRPNVDAVHVITTRGNLADREFEHYHELLTPLGFDVHRMNPDQPPPGPRDGRPTIYIGTSQDVGFTLLKNDVIPGQKASGHAVKIDAGVDEIDEAMVYSNTQYILSEGAGVPAASDVAEPVRWASKFLTEQLNGGALTEADFGRRPGQAGGPAALTPAGRAKIAQILRGKELTPPELQKLNMAATAHWEYVENVHYVNYRDKIYIIDQTTHEVLYDPETSSESRWNGGLAQAIEAKHGLAVRSDPRTSRGVTAKELYGEGVYQRVVGASGTALGKGELFGEKGLSPEIEDIPRYYASRLLTGADHVSPSLGTKLDTIAEDVRTMATGTRRPQLILAHRNDLVARISERLDEIGVPHTAIDAKWFLDQGINRDAAFKKVVGEAGAPGSVLVINMQGARGVDISVGDRAKALGGLQVRVTAHSEVSRDIDIQAENRAARSGDPGSVDYYVSPDDDAFRLSDNPHVHLAVIRYTGAYQADHADSTPATREHLAEAERQLRDLVPDLRAGAAHRIGIHHPTTYLPNAPPSTDTSHISASGVDTSRPGTPRPPEPIATADGQHESMGAAIADGTETALSAFRPGPVPSALAGPGRGTVLDDESWRHSTAAKAEWMGPWRALGPGAVDEVLDRVRDQVRSVVVRTEDGGVLADSVVRQGADGPSVALRAWRSPIVFEVARVEVTPGLWVQAYTYKLHLVAGSGVSPAEAAALWERMQSAVGGVYNQGLRLPGGDVLRVRVAQVPAEQAHQVVRVSPDAELEWSDQLHWRVSASGNELAHEVGHGLGLADEAFEKRQDARVFQDRPAGAPLVNARGVVVGYQQNRVVVDDGLFGARAGAPGAKLKPRHLWLLEKRTRAMVEVPSTPHALLDLDVEPRPQAEPLFGRENTVVVRTEVDAPVRLPEMFHRARSQTPHPQRHSAVPQPAVGQSRARRSSDASRPTWVSRMVPPPFSVPQRRGYQSPWELQADLVTSLLQHHPSGIASSEGLLGPDYFGLRRVPPPPEFLAGHRYSDLPASKVVQFLRRLDMTQRRPQWQDMDPRNWGPHRQYGLARDLPTVERWAPSRSVPRIRERLTMPNAWHSIWLGGPLRDRDFMKNTANNASLLYSIGWRMVLFTDVPRAEFEALDHGIPLPNKDPNRAEAVRNMLEWARRHRILLVNVWEVWNSQTPMFLHNGFVTEMNKQVGAGFAAASDILRLENANRFGLPYTDGDNVLQYDDATEMVDDLLDILDSDAGYAVHRNPEMRNFVGNSAFVVPLGHPFAKMYLDKIALNYGRPQANLAPLMHTPVPSGREDEVRKISNRFSTVARTGPALIPEVLPSSFDYPDGTLLDTLGYRDPREFPRIRNLKMGITHSWAHTSGRDGIILSADRAGTLGFAQRMAADIAREAYNSGTLNLYRLSEAAKRHQDPDMVIDAALAFIATQPEVRARIRAAIRQRLDRNLQWKVGYELSSFSRKLLSLASSAGYLTFSGDWREPVSINRVREARLPGFRD